MIPGDKVVPVGFPRNSRPGIVRMIGDKTAVVTWKMGSGWDWTITHQTDELTVLEDKP